MVMAFKLDLLESYMVEEMTTTSNIAVQSQGTLLDCKSIKKKIASVERHDSEADDDGGKKSKKKKKHKRVSGGDNIMNTESSKANEGSRSHEKALDNSDDDGAKSDTGKRKGVADCDLGNTAYKPKKKRKKNREKIQREYPVADLKKVKHLINAASSNWKMHTINLWSNIEFEFIVKFDIIIVDPKKKDEIMRDHLAFRDSEEYYMRIKKAWKRGYLLYEGKIGENKRDESDEEASDLEEEIGIDKVSDRIDSLLSVWKRDLGYLAIGQNDDVKKNDLKKKSSKKVSLEEVKINNPNVTSNFRILDPLREELEKAQEVYISLVKTHKWREAADARLELLTRLGTITGPAMLYNTERMIPYRMELVADLLKQRETKRVLGMSKKIRFEECSNEVKDVLWGDLMKSIKFMVEYAVERTNVLLYQDMLDLRVGLVSTELRHTLRERYEKLAADVQSSFHQQESDRMRAEFSIKDEKVFVMVSEFKNKSQLLSQTNKIVKEKEEQIEISTTAKRFEQERLRETDTNLKKQTEYWLITHDEVSKLHKKIEWEHVKGEGLREAELIICQRETFSMYLRDELDNIQEEREALRNQHKWKLADNSVKDLLNKTTRREVGGESSSHSELTRLQIFVWMMSGRKTIVIYYVNKNNTVEQLHHKIELNTKILAKEQRVIYKGDSSLHLHGRSDIMYTVSRMLKGDWLDWLVSVHNINEILVTLFPMMPKKATCEYLKILLNFSALDALVMLFASSLEINKSCAKSSIYLFFDNCIDLPDNQQRCCSHVVLEFFRLLKRICPRNNLYVSCRNTLRSVLDLFLGIETKKRKLEYCIENKQEEFEVSWREREKKSENLKLALDDISTEVLKWEMVLSLDMSNLEESGMENFSMIHTLMVYVLKLSKSKTEGVNDATRYMRNVSCLRYLLYNDYTRSIFPWEDEKTRYANIQAFGRAAMTIHATTEIPIVGDIGRGHRIDPDDGKSVTRHIFYDGERLITWDSSKQENVVLPSCEAALITGTDNKLALWRGELHRRIPEQRREDISSRALGRLKFKDMRGIEDLSKMEFKLKGENVGLSLKEKGNLRNKLLSIPTELWFNGLGNIQICYTY